MAEMEWTGQSDQPAHGAGISEEIDNIIGVIRELDPEGIQGISAAAVAAPPQPTPPLPDKLIASPVPGTSQITIYQSVVQMPSQPQHTSDRVREAQVRILEQPASKALRFRYECEGRSAGSIPGANSTPENKTYPTIKVDGYKGRAVVVVSCVTKDEPFKAHPHNLVGKEGCKKGVCTLEINNDDMTVSFSNLGIQCVKKKDIEEALKVREEIRVDPFRNGFAHKTNPASIDLNVVRLCFQVFLEGTTGKFTRPCKPVVSEPIYDKKAMSDLTICKLSDCTSPAKGGREIILLCEKVAKEDIAVRFYEEQNGIIVWQANGEFQHSAVHKQVAIAFKTPAYHTTNIEDTARVRIQLIRPSDLATSDSLPFDYTPSDTDTVVTELRRKRQRTGTDEMFAPIMSQIPPEDRPTLTYQSISPGLSAIKPEPRDQTPSPFANAPMYGGTMMTNPAFDYRNPQATPSPQPTQVAPYSVSPQPNQLGLFPPGVASTPQFNGSPYGLQNVLGTGSAYTDFSFPFPPMAMPTNNIITPVPMSQTLDSVQSINLPTQLAGLSHNDLNGMSIDPNSKFLDSNEVRRILNSDLNAGQRDGDERGLSDSFSLLNTTSVLQCLGQATTKWSKSTLIG